jgi:uncharacterized coiled-coil protein SlyX
MGDASTSHEQLAARVVELETLLTHFQRTLGELDEVVLAQQKRIDGLERKIAALTSELNVLGSSLREERKPEDEKPPHY